jgi:dolichol-phosphate mannosyltransferase
VGRYERQFNPLLAARAPSLVPKNLDPDAPPQVIAAQAREELKADRVGLIRAEDLSTVAQSSAGAPTDATRQHTEPDRTTIKFALATSEPTLVVTGHRRLPQPRTNTRWGSSLAVPVYDGDQPIGVLYATRNFTEHFIEEDLHWLTAYASTSCHIFYQSKEREY